MKALLIAQNSDGYEEVTIVANTISRDNGFHLIIDSKGKLLMGGGMLFENTVINRKIFDMFPKEEQYKVAQQLRLEPHKLYYFEETNFITVNNNVDDDEPLTFTKDEFIQWARTIQEENGDDETNTLEITDYLFAYHYIHTYCDNWDIIQIQY